MAQHPHASDPETSLGIMTKVLSEDMGENDHAKELISDTAAPEFAESVEEKRRSLYFGPEEKALFEDFSSVVERMELTDAIELAPGRTKPPKSLGRYQLVPLKIESSQFTNSAVSAAMRVEEIAGVKFSYEGKRNQAPWLDTSFAIGLVYEDTLSAVAGAHTTPDGHLRIKQLQCVAPPPDSDKGIDKYSSGLHAGFLWRHTLVRAWLQLAEELGISTVEILGATNNVYSNQPENLPRFLVGYDTVAADMGFTKNEAGNWELPVDRGLGFVKLVGRTVLDKQAA
ncbi:MAG TPA: hypothetical protein VFW77_00570 [Candidatus Saccharimonadales bacterium]|nr:hypothetical protein [Candidatus Saccharimonadales bacterium]